MGSMAPPFSKVLIIGAGPAGLLLSLLLAQSNIHSTVLESWSHTDERLRASQYGTPATRIFRRAGILDDIRAVSVPKFPYITWRRTDTHEKVAGIDLSVTSDAEDRMTVLPLNQILEIMMKHCARYPDLIDIRFNHEVYQVGQDEEGAWVIVQVGTKETQYMKQRFRADYLVGCDGATSVVRKSIFGHEWAGETFDFRLMNQNVLYPGFEKHGWTGGNYMIDPEYWGMLAHRGKNGLWRVTYCDNRPNLTDDEYLAGRDEAFRRLLPGNPEPHEYTILVTDQYRIHNRCVESMRKGRILLAADAAHVCNPFGGYGCMSAVLDVGALADCFAGLHQGLCDETILDKWAEIRREKFVKFVDRRSRKNMERIRGKDPESTIKNDEFLKLLRSMEGDEKATKDFLLKWSSIEHDFTQYYQQQ